MRLSSRQLMGPLITIASILLRTNRYKLMQKYEYRRGTSDHDEHQGNKEFFVNLLVPAVRHCESTANQTILDFGCGRGRNVANILDQGHSGNIIGVDISKTNISYCQNRFRAERVELVVSNGLDMNKIGSNSVSSIISVIVLQHIPVYSIRRNLLQEFFRVLDAGGKLYFQMGAGVSLSTPDGGPLAGYYDELLSAEGTNGNLDVQVMSSKEIEDDLNDIGFVNLDFKILTAFSDRQHDSWIYTEATKP